MTPQFESLTGDTGTIIFAMFGPRQHDQHVTQYRWFLRNKKLTDNVRRMFENERLGRPVYEGVS